MNSPRCAGTETGMQNRFLIFTILCAACADDSSALDASASFDASELIEGGIEASLVDAASDGGSARDGGEPDVRLQDADSMDVAIGEGCNSIRDLSSLVFPLDEGRCDGNVAVVCGVSGRWERTSCGTGTTCETYPFTVYENAGTQTNPRYVPSLELRGADCIPEGAEECIWSPDALGGASNDFEPECIRDVRRDCRMPSVQHPNVSLNETKYEAANNSRASGKTQRKSSKVISSIEGIVAAATFDATLRLGQQRQPGLTRTCRERIGR